MANTRKAREWAEHCEREHEKSKDQLSEFYTWRVEHDNQLYVEMRDRPVTSLSMQEFDAKRAKLQQQEIDLLQKIVELEEQVDSAERDLEEAKQALNEAKVAKEKLNEMISVQESAEESEKEYKEEQELEEYSDNLFNRKIS